VGFFFHAAPGSAAIIMNKEDRAKCPYKDCHKTFGGTPNLKYHLKKKHSPNHLRRRPICTYQGCGKAFSSTPGLRKHEKLHNPDRFRCLQCDYKTNHKDELQKHLNRMYHHSFYCQQCDYKTNYKRNFQRHQKSRKHESGGSVNDSAMPACEKQQRIQDIIGKL